LQDTIAVQEGDDLFTLAKAFACKHGMSEKQSINLHALLTRQLQEYTAKQHAV
jgi:hypothetical protein